MSASGFGFAAPYADLREIERARQEAAEIEEASRAAHYQIAAIVEGVLLERERQARIARGLERLCQGCGCSDSRSCPAPDGERGPGCVWANEKFCSQCYLEMNP